MKYNKREFPENFSKVVQNAFKEAEKALEELEKAGLSGLTNTESSQEYVRISFASRRGETFWYLFKCALQVLFTGKTTLLIKKR